MKKNEVYKVVFLFDIHTPLHHEPSIKATLDFMSDYNPDEVIIGGDLGEFEAISHWIDDRRRSVEGKRAKKDFDACQKMLDRIEGCLSKNKDVKKVFIEGNHEDWISQYVDEHPEMEGFLDLDTNLGLTKRGYSIIPLNKLYKVGKLYVIHGWYTNQNHAAKTAQIAGENIIYGHAHQKQIHTVVHVGSSHSATSCPCLCELDKDFLKHKPTSWTHGFAVAEFRSGGLFSLYVVDVISGQFSFAGKVYGKAM